MREKNSRYVHLQISCGCRKSVLDVLLGACMVIVSLPVTYPSFACRRAGLDVLLAGTKRKRIFVVNPYQNSGG